MKKLGIPLAFGSLYENGGTGRLILPEDGAIERLKAVTTQMLPNENSLIVCTAGFSRQSALHPTVDNQFALCDQLNRYVDQNTSDLHQWHRRLCTRPLCWSTRNEIRTGMKYAINEGFASKKEHVLVVASSNLSHHARIWLYLFFYKPKNWSIKVVRARHHFSLKDHLYEVAKFFRDVRYFYRVMMRNHRLKTYKEESAQRRPQDQLS